jgi:cysteine-rich repeat protein
MDRTRATILILCGCLSMPVAAVSVWAQDTCDVTIQLDDPGPLSAFWFGLDYSGAGGDIVGDSSSPNFGPSWGTVPLACTPTPSDEFTAVDDNAGTVSMFFAAPLSTPFVGPLSLVTCVLALDAGFPCPAPSAFSIVPQQFPDDPLPPTTDFGPPPALSITSVTARTPVCGDGFVEGTEACDDGNTASGDCCSSTCTLDSAGTACDDGDVCTLATTCDGAGTCVPGGTLDCDDGVPCTWDRCDPTDGCHSTSGPEFSARCPHFHGVKLAIRDRADGNAKDTLKIAAKLSEGDIGDPATDTGYSICVFDTDGEVPYLADQIDIPAGAPWASQGAGKFSYLDRSGATEGIQKIKLGQKTSGKGKLLLKARGVNTTLPGPFDSTRYFASDTRVYLQIENDAGGCWLGAFHGSRNQHGVKNTAQGFKAKERY